MVKISPVLLSWLIHLYTAVGGLLGFFALYLASLGLISETFYVLLITVFIDSSDGAMARRVNVKKYLPDFDGAMLDNVIDIFTYAYVPFFIIWKLNIFSSPFVLFIPLLGALYAYGQVNMKTEDNYFLGFPTYWNIIALYFYLLPPSSGLAFLILLFFTILCFIPTRYLYPSRDSKYGGFFLTGGIIWIIMIVVSLSEPDQYKTLSILSTFYPVLYMALSFYNDRKLPGKRGILKFLNG